MSDLALMIFAANAPIAITNDASMAPSRRKAANGLRSAAKYLEYVHTRPGYDALKGMSAREALGASLRHAPVTTATTCPLCAAMRALWMFSANGEPHDWRDEVMSMLFAAALIKHRRFKASDLGE